MQTVHSHRSERLLLILAAGRPRSTRMRTRLIDEAERRGITIATLGSRDRLASLERLLAATRPHAIAACAEPSAQGLIAAVAAAADLPFACIPAGMDDLLALDLGVPLDDPAEALALLSATDERMIDLGEVNGVAFVNHAAVGVRVLPLRGRSARSVQPEPVSGATRQGHAGHPYALGIQPADRGEPPSLLVSNNRFALEGATLGARARLDAGVLGVAVWAAEGDGAQGGAREPRWHDYECSRLELSVGGPVEATVDGARRLLRTPLRFRCIRSALRVRAGDPARPARTPARRGAVRAPSRPEHAAA